MYTSHHAALKLGYFEEQMGDIQARSASKVQNYMPCSFESIEMSPGQMDVSRGKPQMS